MGNGDTVPCIINFRTRFEIYVVKFTLQPPYPQGKNCPIAIGQEAGGPQSWFGCGVKVLSLLGIEPGI
jgi:hypothetical protein